MIDIEAHLIERLANGYLRAFYVLATAKISERPDLDLDAIRDQSEREADDHFVRIALNRIFAPDRIPDRLDQIKARAFEIDRERAELAKRKPAGSA